MLLAFADVFLAAIPRLPRHKAVLLILGVTSSMGKKQHILVCHMDLHVGYLGKKRRIFLQETLYINMINRCNIMFETHTYMAVSKNNGTPKSSILIGLFIINHPFWGTPIFGNTHIINRSLKKIF